MNQNVTVIPAKEPAQSGNGNTAGCKRVAIAGSAQTVSNRSTATTRKKPITRSTLQRAQIGSW